MSPLPNCLIIYLSFAYQLAKQNNMVVVCPILERDLVHQNKIFNTAGKGSLIQNLQNEDYILLLLNTKPQEDYVHIIDGIVYFICC